MKKSLFILITFVLLGFGLQAQIAQTIVSQGAGSTAGVSNLALQSNSTGDLNYIATGDDGDLVIYSNGFDESFRLSDNDFSLFFPGTRHMFDSGASNADKAVISHSPAFSTWGLNYKDDVDAFNFAQSLTTTTPALHVRIGNGNIGIGNEAPTQRLEVTAPGANGIRITGNDTGDTRLAISNGGGNHFLFDDDSDAHTLKLESGSQAIEFNVAGPNPAAQINNFTAATSADNNMTVGYSSTAGLTKLYVDDPKSTTSSMWAIIGDSGAAGATGARYGVRGAAVSTTGNRYGVYGDAAAQTGSWAGYFAGNLYYTGTFTSTSDARLKKNIASASYGLETVLAMKPKTYEFKADEQPKGLNLSTGKQIGFLAQDLEALMPEVVSTNNHIFFDNPGEVDTGSSEMEIKSVNYIALIPVLTKAIQDQQEIIQALEARISELEQN